MDTLVVGVSQWKTDIAERSRLNVINVTMLLCFGVQVVLVSSFEASHHFTCVL